MFKYIIILSSLILVSCFNTNSGDEVKEPLAEQQEATKSTPASPPSKSSDKTDNQGEARKKPATKKEKQGKPKGKKPKKSDLKVTPKKDVPNIEPPKIQQTGSFTTDYLMGKFEPRKHPDFTRIGKKYASNGGMWMRKDAYDSFIEMHTAAKKAGINLRIISAVRPFYHQKRIWEAKWTGKRQVDGKMLPKEVTEGAENRALKILRWSSMPGTSRHHWGTDIDLNDLNNSYFERGKGAKIYKWLTENAFDYGFCQVYSPKDAARPDGYQEEKWHWSYLPVSQKLTQLYKEKIQNKDISGFEGAESAELIDVVEKYVLGINQSCL